MDKPRILIIDDDPNLRKTLADILMSRGFETSIRPIFLKRKISLRRV